MAYTNLGVLPPAVEQSLAEVMLAIPVPNYIHGSVAMLQTLPAQGGGTMRNSRTNRLAPTPVPLGSSGAPPPPQSMTRVDIDARIDYYGSFIALNEQVVLQNQMPTLNQAAIVLGEAMRETEDNLIRDMLRSTATQIACTAGVNGDVPTELTRSDIDDVVSILLANNGKTISEVIWGEDRFGTAPVRNAYVAMCHTDLTKSMDSVQGFIHQSQYPSPMNIGRSEWGAIGNVRFLISSIGSKRPNASDNNRTVYDIFISAMEAYSVIDQEAYRNQFIYKPPQFSDPLNQTVTCGWKAAFVPALLNDAWIVDLTCTLPA